MNNILKFFLTLALIASVGIVALAQDAPKKKVAVYMTGKDINESYKKVIGAKLVTGITRSDDYAAVERTADFLAELTKEQDYQMSGAVSDNQIARLGQQFGVRYVLVADISEVFESMFISARMIDVQTAQITNSAEANGAVSSMENLTKLAEDIVLVVLTTPKFTGDTVKLLQSCSSFSELRNCHAPEGYHIATKEEIYDIIKEYQIMGNELSFPIYTNIETSVQPYEEYFKYYYYTHRGKRKTVNGDVAYRPCKKHIVTYIAIDSSGVSSFLKDSYIEDPYYSEEYTNRNYPDTDDRYGCMTVGLYDRATNPPQIAKGYVYIVKNR